MSSKLTYKDVHDAADLMRSQGVALSVRSLRSHLGRGSNSTIQKHLTSYLGTQGASVDQRGRDASSSQDEKNAGSSFHLTEAFGAEDKIHGIEIIKQTYELLFQTQSSAGDFQTALNEALLSKCKAETIANFYENELKHSSASYESHLQLLHQQALRIESHYQSLLSKSFAMAERTESQMTSLREVFESKLKLAREEEFKLRAKVQSLQAEIQRLEMRLSRFEGQGDLI